MKRILMIALAALLVCTPFCFAAFAGNVPTEVTDEEYVTFTVPAGWTDVSDHSDGEKQYTFAYDAFKFDSEDADDPDASWVSFIYNAEDYYTSLDEQLQAKFTREDLDSQTMTVEDFQAFEDAFEGEDSDALTNMQITKETIGNHVYFKVTATINAGFIPGEFTAFIRLQDGDGYLFGIVDFSGLLEDNSDVDFDGEQTLKSIVENVKYNRETPIETISAGVDRTKAAGEDGDSSSGSAVRIAVAAAVVIAAAVCVVIVARKKKSKAAAVTANEPVPQAAPAAEPGDTDRP